MRPVSMARFRFSRPSRHRQAGRRSGRRALYALPLAALALVSSQCASSKPEPPPEAARASEPPAAASPSADAPTATDGPKNHPPSTPSAARQRPRGRLPDAVEPLAYDLELRIDPSRPRFAGTARIDVRLQSSQEVIWLHGRDLNVSSVTVTVSDARQRAEYEQVTDSGLAKVRLAEPIGPGEATLAFRYDAPFNERLTGLYKVTEAEQAYAFTQFQPISARRCFPSFDEPRFKVPFELAVQAPSGHEVITATPELSRQNVAAGVLHRFAPTPPLPTYLIAFAVGPFDVVEAKPIGSTALRERAIPLRGIAAAGKGDALAYALKHTPAILTRLERYFDAPMPFKKLDLLAVPDFAAGAMENVGAVTFRESLLLLNAETASASQKRWFAYVTAHELAHMWFGNLVTMPWWNDIWLNEAFATWMNYKAVDDLWPDYHADIQRLQAVHRAMEQDSLEAARRIREPVKNTHDIFNAFDGITYSKGAGVLAMFERYLGPEVFRDGVRAHMDTYAFANADVTDLLASLSQAAGQDIKTPFETFLTQPGVPHLKVQPACAEGQLTLSLAQQRYLPVGSQADAQRTWQLPVCVRYGKGEQTQSACTLMREADQRWSIPVSKCPEWLLPNAHGAGYYRWSLPETHYVELGQQAALTSSERLALADAVRAAFAAGSLSAEAAYRALEPLAVSDVRAVAAAPVALLRFTHEHLAEPGWRDGVAEYGAELYQSRYERLSASSASVDGEEKVLFGDLSALLGLDLEVSAVRTDLAAKGRAYVQFSRSRARALAADRREDAGQAGSAKAAQASSDDAAQARSDKDGQARAGPDTDVTSTTQLETETSGAEPDAPAVTRDGREPQSLALVDRSAVDPNIAPTALAVAVQSSEAAFFNHLVGLLETARNAIVRRHIVTALGRARRPELAQKARALALSETLRTNEVLRLLTAHVEEPKNRFAAWGWLQENHRALAARLSKGARGRMPTLAQHFCSREKAKEVQAFFAPFIDTLTGGPRKLAEATESIRLCAARVKAQRASARRFFAQYSSAGPKNRE